VGENKSWSAEKRPGFVFFFLRIFFLCSSQSGDDYPENNLANFGYILDMKVGKINKIVILLYSWLSTGTYHKNLPIWGGGKKINLKYLVNLGLFLCMKNPLYRSKSYF